MIYNLLISILERSEKKTFYSNETIALWNISKRPFMRYGLLLFCLLSLQLYGENNVDKLKAGNRRFLQGGVFRQELVAAQTPFCAIVACADSRVSPELIFDQGLGELFVVRVAGNVAAQVVVESLDFACNVLKVNVIVVMGHQNCGAVDAVWQHKGDKDLGTIANLIQPAVQNKKNLREAVISNVMAQIAKIKTDPALQSRLKDGSLKITGAYYNFDTGVVDFFE
jgi:carbonic anhydrase